MLTSSNKRKIANAAVNLWQGDANSIQYISDSGNYVFSFIESGKKCYLRLTPIYERTKNQIQAELDFVTFLHSGGVSVMLPILSKFKRLIEEINFTEYPLFACFFKKRKANGSDTIPLNPTRSISGFAAKHLDKFTLFQKFILLQAISADSPGTKINY